ncbi:MAG: hypothetical protein V4718_04250 [Pseudomonadota bacterium]
MSIQRIYCIVKEGECTQPGICDRRRCHQPPVRQYEPDFGITRGRYTRGESTPLLHWILAIFAVVMLVIAAYRNA